MPKLNDANAVYVGGVLADAVYAGTVLVWPPVVPPSGDVRWPDTDVYPATDLYPFWVVPGAGVEPGASLFPSAG